MQPRFHRVRVKTEEACGFLCAHPLDYARHEHDSKGFWQVVGRALDKPQNFPLR